METIRTAPLGAKQDEVAEFNRRLGQLGNLVQLIQRLSDTAPELDGSNLAGLQSSLEGATYLLECHAYRMRMLLTTYVTETKLKLPT